MSDEEVNPSIFLDSGAFIYLNVKNSQSANKKLTAGEKKILMSLLFCAFFRSQTPRHFFIRFVKTGIFLLLDNRKRVEQKRNEKKHKFLVLNHFSMFQNSNHIE